jgi:type IV pilus biogenesis protein PilP
MELRSYNLYKIKGPKMFKKLMFFMCVGLISVGVNYSAFAVEEVIEEADIEMADRVSAEALMNYNENGSLFEKITVLEQEKVVAQLEKERAQLDLDLERLNAERIKLQIELDTLSGRAEQQQQELEAAKAQLEIQTEKLKKQMNTVNEEPEVVAKVQEKKEESSVSKKYKLINIVGIDNQLQATIEEIPSGQNKRIAVGKELDGYIVKSISLNEGIIFEKDGETESLNVGK